MRPQNSHLEMLISHNDAFIATCDREIQSLQQAKELCAKHTMEIKNLMYLRESSPSTPQQAEKPKSSLKLMQEPAPLRKMIIYVFDTSQCELSTGEVYKKIIEHFPSEKQKSKRLLT